MLVRLYAATLEPAFGMYIKDYKSKIDSLVERIAKQDYTIEEWLEEYNMALSPAKLSVEHLI